MNKELLQENMILRRQLAGTRGDVGRLVKALDAMLHLYCFEDDRGAPSECRYKGKCTRREHLEARAAIVKAKEPS